MAITRGTVLLVEDEPAIRELVVMFLQDEGFEVQQAQDGEEAIHALDQNRPPAEHPCLVLLDMMLPKASGEDVLHHLAEKGAYIPVIAMSASRQKLEVATQAGAQAILPKPFDLNRLRQVVDRCCPH